jgi:sarcosine oxidase subunit gamma
VSDPYGIGGTDPGRYGAVGESGLSLREVAMPRAWNVQGDPAKASIDAAVRETFGVALPQLPNTTSANDRWLLAWLGPTSWLALALAASADRPFNATRDALNGAGAALFEVSAARVGWRLTGPRAAAVLAKWCPLDFDLRAFAVGGCAQSTFGHMNAIYLRTDADTFVMLISRSYARDAWHALATSAAQYGYDILPPAPTILSAVRNSAA